VSVDPHAPDESDAVTLSTGETIELPIALEATMAGVVLSGERARVADLLPVGLVPLRSGRATAPVGFLSVEYRDVGDGALAPYDEFAVIVGARPRDSSRLPSVSSLRRAGGYVWYMPVTHESARAFGDEVWGYPKVVADVEVEESVGRRRTTVAVDGVPLVRMAVERPRTVALDDVDAIRAFTVPEGTLSSVRGTLSGRAGIWPCTDRFGVELGDHPVAERLRGLGLGDRALARTYADGEVVFGPGRPVDGEG
jgi:hypothetical protein